MPTPVRRYPPVETIQRETSRRLIRQQQRHLQRQSDSCTDSRGSSSAGAATALIAARPPVCAQRQPPPPPPHTADGSERQSASDSEYDADSLLEDTLADDLRCQPVRTCRACCLLGVVVLLVSVVFTLSLAKTHIGRHVIDEHELTGVVFLVLLLFFLCLMLFFVRCSMILFEKRAVSRTNHIGADQTARHDASPNTDRALCRTVNATPSGGRQENHTCSAPPPYHEALSFPVVAQNSPPPTYDKINL